MDAFPQLDAEEGLMQVIVRLRILDGREFDVHTEVDAKYADSQEFYWTEGNAACDCNRSLYLNREHGLNLVDDGEDGCLSCGDTIELLSIKCGDCP